MLELYNFRQSTCSQKVRLCLAEKGLEWLDRRLDSRKQEHLGPDYLKLNPNGLVPTLVHDGHVIIDSSVIMEYLEEVFPEISLSPPGPVGRAKMRKWLRYFDEVSTPSIRYPSFNKFLIRTFQKMDAAQFAAAAEARPLRKHFYQRMGQDGFPQDDIDRALENLGQSMDRVEAALAEHGGPWIMGEQFTIVDAAYLPNIDRLDDLGYAQMWQDGRPLVTGWDDRIRRRPSYGTAYYEGSRLSALFSEPA